MRVVCYVCNTHTHTQCICIYLHTQMCIYVINWSHFLPKKAVRKQSAAVLQLVITDTCTFVSGGKTALQYVLAHVCGTQPRHTQKKHAAPSSTRLTTQHAQTVWNQDWGRRVEAVNPNGKTRCGELQK